MTDSNAALANKPGLQPRKVETPGMSYSFYCESDADMTTVEGRLEWFCKHFEVDHPSLEYDEDEPDQILMTEELITFCQIEGVSLDWIILGYVAGAIKEYREKHKLTHKELEFIRLMRRFTEAERLLLVEAIERGNEPGADFSAEISKAAEQIEEKKSKS